MRYSLLLIPLAVIGLSGCASSGVPASRYAMNTQTTRLSARGGYLTPEQSSGLIMLPGDTTTPTQLRFLSQSDLATRDDWRMAASGDPGQKVNSELMAGNIPH